MKNIYLILIFNFIACGLLIIGGLKNNMTIVYLGMGFTLGEAVFVLEKMVGKLRIDFKDNLNKMRDDDWKNVYGKSQGDV